MKTIKQITLRDPSPELVDKLKDVAAARGQSLNGTILLILEEALGIRHRRLRLERYATWTSRDSREFDKTLRQQRTIDEALWR